MRRQKQKKQKQKNDSYSNVLTARQTQYPPSLVVPPPPPTKRKLPRAGVLIVVVVALAVVTASIGVVLFLLLRSPSSNSSPESTVASEAWANGEFELYGKRYKCLESKGADFLANGWNLDLSTDSLNGTDPSHTPMLYKGDAAFIVGGCTSYVNMVREDDPEDTMWVRLHNPSNELRSCADGVLVGANFGQDTEEGDTPYPARIAGQDLFSMGWNEVLAFYGLPNSEDPAPGTIYMPYPDTSLDHPIGSVCSYEQKENEYNSRAIVYNYYENNQRFKCSLRIRMNRDTDMVSNVSIQFDDSWVSTEENASPVAVTERPSPEETHDNDTQDEYVPKTPEDEVAAVDALPPHWEEGAFVLEGVLYKMGESTREDLLNNGWKVQDAFSDEKKQIEPRQSDGSYRTFMLSTSNRMITVLFGNPDAESPCDISECPIVGVLVDNDWDAESRPSLILPGKIALGSHKDAVVSVYGEPHAYQKKQQYSNELPSTDVQYESSYAEDDARCVWSLPYGSPTLEIYYNENDTVIGIGYE